MKKYLIAWVLLSSFLLWILFFSIPIFIYPQMKELSQDNKTPKLDGKWKFTFVVEKSSYEPFIWEENNYNILLNQKENEIWWSWKDLSDDNFSIEIKWNLLWKDLKWFYDIKWRPIIPHRQIEWSFSEDWNNFKWISYWYSTIYEGSGPIDYKSWINILWTISWKRLP